MLLVQHNHQQAQLVLLEDLQHQGRLVLLEEPEHLQLLLVFQLQEHLVTLEELEELGAFSLTHKEYMAKAPAVPEQLVIMDPAVQVVASTPPAAAAAELFLTMDFQQVRRFLVIYLALVLHGFMLMKCLVILLEQAELFLLFLFPVKVEDFFLGEVVATAQLVARQWDQALVVLVEVEADSQVPLAERE